MEFKKQRYTECIKALEQDKASIRLEMKEHIFSNYMRFIEIFKEFKEVQSVSIDCYDSCFDTIKASLKDLLTSVNVKKLTSSSAIQKASPEWWQELPDELDLLLADEKYEECVGFIEEVRKMQIPPESIKYKLEFDVHVLKVIECIAKELQKPQVVAPEIYISYLERLDARPAAEDAYFLGKSQQLKLYMRRTTITELPVEGIPKQCQIFVSLLRSTISESLKLALSTAKLFTWISEEIKSIAWEVGETLHMIEKVDDLACVFHSILRSFDALEQIGLSLSLTFQYSFLPFIQKKIQELYVKEESKVEMDIAGELWKAQIVQVEGSSSVLRFSSSGCSLYAQILRIVQECALFYDDHLKAFAGLVPLFLKTIKALLEKFIESDKFDDRKDPKIVQVITCNLWNLSSLIPFLCKKINEKLNIPHMEIPDLMVVETDASIRGDDILHAFALTKWNEEIPSYLTSLHNAEKLQSPDEISTVLNLKHCQFIKEGIESISSSTDRNHQRIEKYCKIVSEAYIQVLDELLYRIGGHFELNEISVPGFQQLIVDLSIFDLVSKSVEVDSGMSAFIRKIVSSYIKKKNTEELLLRFKEEIYKEIYLKVFH